MKTIILTAIFLLTAQTRAETSVPLIRSAQVSEVDYRAFLLSEPRYYTASRALLNERPASENGRELRERYEEAERNYISADLTKAHAIFISVTELAFKDDWNEAQRAMLFHAYLRGAQTAPTPEARQSLLHLAARFSHSEKIDEKLFPPPLVEEFKIVQSEEGLVPVTLSRSFNAYSYALLNGEVVEFRKYALRVPSGEFRLTLLSDSLKPITRVLNASALKQWQPNSEFLATGDCQKPNFAIEGPAKSAALYEGDCVTDKSASALAHAPTLIEKTLQNREPFLRATNPSSVKPFYQNKWLWGLVGVATAAIVIDQNRDRESNSGGGSEQPTVKDGF